ncbi:MAG: zinc ribbon domain-containing protein [Candidatus Promineifilaceae bacterium]|nr:zinc ribbon domain-containing protein [Candidatus Promineifilaceae bacterium]
MTLPSVDAIIAYTTICFAIFGALLAALWLSLVIWTFRDMRNRSRDPFAQILSVLVVALLPGIGLIVYLILRPPETLAEAYERALEEEALLQEIEDRPTCPGCSRVVNPQWILCPHCHTRLHKACPHCNNLMELHWNLCPYCGSQQVDVYASGSLRTDPDDIGSMPPETRSFADDSHPVADDDGANGWSDDTTDSQKAAAGSGDEA